MRDTPLSRRCYALRFGYAKALAEQSAAFALMIKLLDANVLDYHGPTVREAQKQKRDNRKGYLSFVGGVRFR